MNVRRFGVLAAVGAIMLAGAVNAGAEPDGRLDPVAGRASAPQLKAETPPARYVPVTPRRVLDTRDYNGPLGAGGTVTVDMTGRIADTATAVVLNVTATAPTAATYITAYPSDQPRPVASNLNVVTGDTRANAVTVALSADRLVTFYNQFGKTHLVVDLAGYYATDQGAGFTAEYTPQRVLDTRYSGPVGAGGVVNAQLNLASWDRPTAAVLNVTAVDASASTFVTAYTPGTPLPLASSLNSGPGQIVPNQVTVPLNNGRAVSLYNKNGYVHLVVDVIGYYRNGSGSDFVAITPVRFMDTRPDGGLYPDSDGISLTGWGPDIDAVAANLTGTNPTANQYVSVWPGGAPRPNSSNLNLVYGQTAANAVTVGVGYENVVEDYAVNFVNNAGYVDLIFDVAGFFVAPE